MKRLQLINILDRLGKKCLINNLTPQKDVKPFSPTLTTQSHALSLLIIKQVITKIQLSTRPPEKVAPTLDMPTQDEDPALTTKTLYKISKIQSLIIWLTCWIAEGIIHWG